MLILLEKFNDPMVLQKFLRVQSSSSMSTRGLKRPSRGVTRDTRRRKMVLDVDLNVDPPAESRAAEGAVSFHGNTEDGHVGRRDAASSSAGRIDNPLIDVEAIDDEVVISSPRSFREARNHSRRNPPLTVVLDEDSDIQRGQSGSLVEEPVTRLALNSYYSRARNSTNETIINCELYINLDGNSNTRRRNAGRHNVDEQNTVRTTKPILDLESLPSSAPSKEEPTFSCAVCMGPLVEASSTICGHIFCKACIKAAITAQKKCPTCRRKLSASNVHRIYLPPIN